MPGLKRHCDIWKFLRLRLVVKSQRISLFMSFRIHLIPSSFIILIYSLHSLRKLHSATVHKKRKYSFNKLLVLCDMLLVYPAVTCWIGVVETAGGSWEFRNMLKDLFGAHRVRKHVKELMLTLTVLINTGIQNN